MSVPYEPVCCSFQDTLETAAVLRRPVEIVFKEVRKSVLAKDIQTRHQAEYLIALETEAGEELVLPLDAIGRPGHAQARRT